MQKQFYHLFLSFIFIHGFLVNSHAQTSLPNTVPKIFPPAPEVAALAKYVDIPVSLYTGVPQITHPIYTISEGDISVPIYLSYQSGGFKADELASRTGLGWVLNAGGVITRSIRGYADEYEDGFMTWSARVAPENFNSGTAAELFQRYDGIARSCGDAEPDEFFMNFNGITGKFCFNWNGTISYSCSQQLKITPLEFVPGIRNYIQRWEVITQDGMKYEFDVGESTKVLNWTEFFSCTHRQEQVNTWHLSRITAPNGEFVNFSYTPYTFTYRIFASEVIKHQDYTGPGVREISIIRNRVKGWVLSQISTSSGQTMVEFKAIKTRLDVEPPDPTFTDNVTTDYNSLDSIIIKNKSNATIVKHALNYDYSSARLMLKSIIEIGTDGITAKPPTQFQYKPGIFPLQVLCYTKDHWGFLNSNLKSTLIPPYSYNGMYADGADRNADPAKSQTGLLTKILYPAGGSQTFEYEPHDYNIEDYVQKPAQFVEAEAMGGPLEPDTVTSAPFTVGLLSSPMRIDYYCHLYAVGGDPSPRVWLLKNDGSVFCIHNAYPFADQCVVGSVEVNETLYIDPSQFPPGTYRLRAFARGVGVNAEGANVGDEAYISATWTDRATELSDVTKIAGGARIKTITSEATPGDPNKTIKRFEYKTDDGLSSGEIVDEITNDSYASETMTNTSSDPNALIAARVLTRLSSTRSTLGSTQGSHIGYSQVTVYNGANGENGKSISKFMSPNEYPDYSTSSFPYPPATNMDYHRGQLEEETQYKKSGSSYIAINKSLYHYRFAVTNIPAFRVGIFITGDGPWGQGYLNRYGHAEYSQNIGLSQVDTLRSDLIESGKIFRNESYKSFDASLHFLKKETKMVSGGKQLSTEFFYPQDYLLPSMTMLEMMDLHRFPLIEQLTSEKGADGIKKTIGGSYTEYKKIGSIITPERYYKLAIIQPIENFPGTINRPSASVNPSVYKEISRNIAFDSTGNILQVKSKEKQDQVYIWGYDKTLPVARVENAQLGDVAFSDFEDSDMGGFAFDISAANFSSDSRTGKRSFRGNTITRSISNNSFKISCWAKSAGTSSVTVNGVSKTTGSNWTYCEWDITNTSSITLTTNGCLIDGLRLHPVGSLMETFTYEPLIGLTSSSSVNNTTTYYEYDALRRLSIVRDQNKNIVKSYQYNY